MTPAGKVLAASAAMGILLACGGAPRETKQPAPALASGEIRGAQDGCGNHDGGACGSKDVPEAPAGSH